MSRLLTRILLALTALAAHADGAENAPKLIVQITVDQLRADLLYRYQDEFLTGRKSGFNQFLQRGIAYTNAHYRHSATLTAVGHATLATGALPSQHGIIANEWFDPASGQPMYCVADASTQLLNGDRASASPVNLTSSTFSDELYLATNGKAKIYSTSIKDRGAVLTGGRFGKSFWFDKNTGNMVTSDYYYQRTPQWLTAFNQSGEKDKYVGKAWNLSQDEEDYHNDAGNRLYQIPPRGFSRGFPHQMPVTADKAYYGLLSFTPFGDQLTVTFAKMLIDEHKMGEDDVTDFLAVSFSTNDYVGHMFGPNSLEAEDNLLQLDRTLANLFQYLDEKIGLKHVLIAISADHGVDAIPEYKQSLGFRAMRKDIANMLRTDEVEIMQSFDTDKPLIRAIKMPNVYLDHSAIADAGLDLEDVQTAFANKALSYEGIAYALTAEELKEENFSHHPVLVKVQNNFHPQRSGDIVLVQQSSAMLGNYSAATHGSPYRYDTHVPLHFTGFGLKPQTIGRTVSPEDLATTLSALLKISLPDKASGQPLVELLQ